MEMTIYWSDKKNRSGRLHYVRVDGLKSAYLTFEEVVHALAEYNLTDVWPSYMRFTSEEREQLKQIEHNKQEV